MKAFAYINRYTNKYISFVNPRFNNRMHGIVTFEQFLDFIRISFEIFGLTDGLHGFHIHEKPLTLAGLHLAADSSPCKECCSHFNGDIPILSENNPDGTPHGLHLGDLCFNIQSIDGVAIGTFDDHNLSIIPGRNNNIVGRSIVIHADQDDMGIMGDDGNENIESLITGNAGDRLACANIYYY